MEYRLESGRSFTLVGMNFFGNPFQVAGAWDEDNEIGSLWKRFMAFMTAIPSPFDALPPGDPAWFEAHVAHPSSEETGAYEVFVGTEVPSPMDVPISCVIKPFPSTDYAIATIHGKEMVPGWEERVEADALGRFGRAINRRWGLQRYDSRFKGMNLLAESVFEMWIPLLADERGGKTI